MFFESFFKGPGQLPSILIITFSPATSILIYNVTLFLHLIFVFWEHQYVLQCVPPLWICAGQFIYGVVWRQSPINCSEPPRWWKRFVDVTFVILKQDKKEEFLQHINSVDPAIQFTTQKQKQDGSMPFLDILVTPQEDGTLTTRVYRKPTHTDQYLQWDSHQNLACKYSVINTLTHRAKAVCSSSPLLKEELKHLEEALTQCKYPKWAFQKILRD